MTTPRRINADVFRRARKAGATLDIAAYVAKPAAIELDWLSHAYHDETWTDFEVDGRKFRAELRDPRVIEGECIGCRELVDAYRQRDEGMAWLTPEQYDEMVHRTVRVVVLDEDDDETSHEASLWGVCGLQNTFVDVLVDERYLAETVLDLASEAAGLADDADEARRGVEIERRARLDAERRDTLNRLVGVAVAHGASPDDDMRDGFRRELGWLDDQTVAERLAEIKASVPSIPGITD